MKLKYLAKVVLFITIIIVSKTTFAQNQNTIDSLKTVIRNAKQDTTIIHAYLKLADKYRNHNSDSNLYYCDLALEKSIKVDYKKGIADIYMQRAVDAIYFAEYFFADSLLNKAISIYREIDNQYGVMKCYLNFSKNAYYKVDYRLLLEYSAKALKIAENNDYIKDKATIFTNIGVAYIKLGDYEKSMKNQLNALKIFEELNNKKSIAGCNVNIGLLLIKMNEYDKGLEYMYGSLKIFTELENIKGQSICHTNIGDVYKIKGKYNEALQQHNRALELDKKSNNLHGISTDYNCIGSIYFLQKKYNKALEYFNKALKISEQLRDNNEKAKSFFKLANVEMELRNYKVAEEFCLKSMNLFKQNKELENQQKSLELLSLIYNSSGRYNKAYNTYINAVMLKDSLFNIEKAEKIAQLEEKYLNEKLEKENLTLKFEKALQHKEISQQKKLSNIYLIAFIFAIVAVVLIFIQYKKRNIAYKFLVKKNMDLLNRETELKTIKEQVKADDSKSVVSDDEKEKILKKLKKLFEVEKIFTKYDLTIDKLAKQLSTNRSYLSQIINDEFGKNYSDFITEYRVKEAMLMLSDSQKTIKYSIEAIANDAGFKTLSSFNPTFKKITGVTPSVFKNNAITQ